MCTSPIKIKNHSVYNVGYNQPSFYDVPCGKCLECRNLGMSEWQTRLSYEIDSLYKRKGVAIFLTFTYNDDNLPYIQLGDVMQSCFDRKSVLKFLNQLKVRIYRLYGKRSYKYFFTSEYGSHTKRPHYHALFFLENVVNPTVFAETCRDLWVYGYMFPKFDLHKNTYVDNFGKPSQITIRSLAGGAKYVSKYITKDLSFYDLPHISAYLADNKNCDKNFLPKHWQSNGLGYSLVENLLADRYDEVAINVALTQGVFNPLFGKLMPIPRYAINKLMYSNVYTGRVNVNGRKLYDRELSAFGKVYLRNKISVKLSQTCGDIYSFLANISSYDKYIKQNGLERIYKLAPLFTNKVSDCKTLATYMLVWKYIPKKEIIYHINQSYGDCDTISSFTVASSQYVLQHDTEYFRRLFYDNRECPNLPYQQLSWLDYEFEIADFVTYCYSLINSQIRKDRLVHYKRLSDATSKMRLWFNAFPNNLC